MEEITSYWKNRTNGKHCVDVFTQITEKFELLQEVVYDIDGLIETYNRDCNDKCLPGYVKCKDDEEEKCILRCDCCAHHNLECCDSDNHPTSSENYAVGEEDEPLYCYDFCCEDNQVFCDDVCIDIGNPLGPGNSLPYPTDDYGGVGSNGEFPIICCTGDDCCEDGEIWPEWISPDQFFCCVPDEIISGPDGDFCCCDMAEHTCCPNLDVHCQSDTNVECCDLNIQEYCHGECWPKGKPCCDYGEYNCEH